MQVNAIRRAILIGALGLGLSGFGINSTGG